MFNEILELTKKLVSIGSVNGSAGEKSVGVFIEEYFRSMPYFKKHPEQVIVQKLKNDPLGRRNVFVLLRGEKEESGDTILLHGHTDTVGIEDYGSLIDYAFDCDTLFEKLKEVELADEVKEDLLSGDYLFGRGACDMKSGDAVFMVIMKHLSEKAKDIKGNIIVSLNPVEENLHTGIIEGIDILEDLREKYKLNYLFAINNDYICPLYPNDTTRYVYTGAVGKMLPCFYILGKETHVGQCFEGFDASLVASELIKNIDLNTDFCEQYNGEYTLPPSVLKMKDLKKQYNVQTSFSSFVYFNYFIHNASTTEIMQKLRKAANDSMEQVVDLINDRYKKFCELTKIEYGKIDYKRQVLSFDELVKLASRKYDQNIEDVINSVHDEDKRENALLIVQKLCDIAKINIPTVVVFFAAPYCPHNTLKKEVKEEDILYKQIESIVNEFRKESNQNYKICQFFPSLSDSSYLKIDDDTESIKLLIDNFPGYKNLYNVPLERIKNLNIPAINYGCYGKDAHKWTERVYMPYSFEILPKLIIKTLKYYLN